MTGREFSEVDIDLLADYVGGALDGTPDEPLVTALIADDPAWRTAHDSLVAGMAAVGAELHALGATPALMPDDVTARLAAALAGAAEHAVEPATPDRGAPDAAARDTHSSDGGDPRSTRHLGVVPGGMSSAVSRRVPAPRRGLRRWAAPVAAAAGVLAFAGFGVQHLWEGGGAAVPAAERAAESNAQADENAPMAASDMPEQGAGNAGPAAAAAGVLAEAPPPASITAGDTDYDTTTLAGRAAPLDSASPPQRRVADQLESARDVVPGLQRLSDRDALAACLVAIARELGTGPIAVAAVEYARFAGAPAVIARFAAADGEWVWASGADCGLPGVGADTLHPVKVG